MVDYNIEKYLQEKHLKLDQDVFKEIESKKEKAIQNKNEDEANYYWFLSSVFQVQNGYLSAFADIVNENYQSAWNRLDKVDIDISYLELNPIVDCFGEKFNIDFIGAVIHEYQKLFPYRFFISREAVIKEEKCSICGKKNSLRNPCGHIAGKVYMGKLCLYMVTQMEFRAIAIVEDPYDKYAILKLAGVDFDYCALNELMKKIKSPYDNFYVTIEKSPASKCDKVFNTVCGGKKESKTACDVKNDELIDHYVIHFEPNAFNQRKENSKN